MKTLGISRRMFVTSGVCAVSAAGILKSNVAQSEQPCLTADAEATVRKYYKLWEQKEWRPFEILLADNFTFTSAAGDDHISKTAFKKQCWETQIGHIKRFDLHQVFGNDKAAFVLYDGYTMDDRNFRNAEYLRVRDGKIESIECYFGKKNSFASAVSGEHK